MGKSKKKKNSDKHAEGHAEEDDDLSDNQEQNDALQDEKQSQQAKWKELDFPERRELKRKEAADKSRSKQRCFQCGKRGHVIRNCPRISGPGAYESKHKNARDDADIRGSKKGAKNRGRKIKKEESDTPVEYPEGFSIAKKQDENGRQLDGDAPRAPFHYYDTGSDSMATLEYIRNGRSKQKTTLKEAINEYQAAINEACSSSNYGGRISRSLIRPNRSWAMDSVSPLEEDNIWHVIGLARDFLYNDTDKEAAMASLVQTKSENEEKVIGFFCDLDYSSAELSRAGCDRDSQIRRLVCTFLAASKVSVPIQVRISPAGAISRAAEVNSEEAAAYREVMEHLGAILSEILTMYPSLKVHLSCWSGEPDDMSKMLQTFPKNIWIGMDASVTFAKVVRAHECAFDVPLHKLLLETGMPTTIPAVIAKSKGRGAFNHSGLIPYTAQAIALEKSKASDVSPEEVGRAAFENTGEVYPHLVKRDADVRVI